jgi:hypothetical protein
MAGIYKTIKGWTLARLRPAEPGPDHTDLNLHKPAVIPAHRIEQGALPWAAEQHLKTLHARQQRHHQWRSGPWQLK